MLYKRSILENQLKNKTLGQNIPDLGKILIFILLVLLFGAVFSALGLFICIPLFGFSTGFENLAQEVAGNVKAEILVQIFSAIGAFVVPALVYAKLFEYKPSVFFKANKLPSFKTLIFTFAVFLLANFVLSLLVQLTQLIPFADFDSKFIKTLLETEALTELAFKRFLNFTSPLFFVLVFIMMAVLPALGEELTFRGVFFNLFERSTQNTVFAILFSALIFALIHFQLHNFLAIFFMGVLLAYIYHITQNIWLSIAAHLFNNGMIVILSYISHLGIIEYDFSKNDDFPLIVSIFGALVFFITLYFYRLWIKKEKNNIYE